jgi:purine-cytosine permease-like protein
MAKPTRAWYLVPIFFNIFGGIIGYSAVKNDDKRMANRLLITGLVVFVLVIAVIALFSLAAIAFLGSIAPP